MKKLLSLIITVTLLLTLASCTKRGGEAAVPEAEPPQQNTAAPTEPSAPAVGETAAPAAEPAVTTKAPEAPAEEMTVDAQEGDTPLSILQGIYESYFPGSAGCSLVAAQYAGRLLDWYAVYGNEETVRGSGANFAASHDLRPEAVAPNGVPIDFPWKLSDIYYSAMNLAFGDIGILDSAGYTQQQVWDAQSADALFKMLYEGLGMERPDVVTVYYSDENAERFLTADIPTMVSEYSVLAALQTAGVLSREVELRSFSREGDALYLDLSETFASALCSTGTTGEYMLLGAVVNTYLDAFGAESLTFTVEGAVVESGHSIYDFALTRFADNVVQ